MKTIPAGEFKAKCLQLMDKVQRTRKPIMITKRGKPVAKLVPVEQEQDEWFGRLRGKVNVTGDLVAPLDPPEVWESAR